MAIKRSQHAETIVVNGWQVFVKSYLTFYLDAVIGIVLLMVFRIKRTHTIRCVFILSLLHCSIKTGEVIIKFYLFHWVL